jgi:hypothetical protein
MEKVNNSVPLTPIHKRLTRKMTDHTQGKAERIKEIRNERLGRGNGTADEENKQAEESKYVHEQGPTLLKGEEEADEDAAGNVPRYRYAEVAP